MAQREQAISQVSVQEESYQKRSDRRMGQMIKLRKAVLELREQEWIEHKMK